MDIDLTAKLGSFDDFVAQYKPRSEKKLYEGKSLVFLAIANANSDARYRIASFLLDKGGRIDGTSSDGSGIFHLLLERAGDDIPHAVELLARLIDKGADANLLDERGADAIVRLIPKRGSDEELAPLYDLWFSQRLTNLTTPDKTGYSPLEAARLLPFRAGLAQRMEDYLAR